MPKQSSLIFKNYTVTELNYIQVPVAENAHEFELKPEFNQKLIELDHNKYDVELSIKIAPSKDRPLPFKLYASIVGHFEYDDVNNKCSEEVKDDILHKNTVSILFPFLRSIVATLSTTANIPTLVLPIMNFSDDN